MWKIIPSFLLLLASSSPSEFAAEGFVPVPALTPPRRSSPSSLRAKSSSSDNNSNGSNSSSNDFDFMADLRSRVQEIKNKETRLPLIVLDSMLPRQVKKIKLADYPVVLDLVRRRLAEEEPYFGMAGMVRSPATGQDVLLRSGVRVDVVGKPLVDKDGALQIELRATDQLFQIVGEIEDNLETGWAEARVEFLDYSSCDDESSCWGEHDRIGLINARDKARKLPGLVSEWIQLASEREKSPGQIVEVLQNIGVMPASYKPSTRSMWVGALINSLNELEVALEIRPTLLSARTPEQRVNIAIAGLEESIMHMRGLSGKPIEP